MALSPIAEKSGNATVDSEFDDSQGFIECLQLEAKPKGATVFLTDEQKKKLESLHNQIDFQIECGAKERPSAKYTRPGSLYGAKKYSRERKETIPLKTLKINPDSDAGPKMKNGEFNLFDFYSVEAVLGGVKSADGGCLSCDEWGNFALGHIYKCLKTSNITKMSTVTMEWVRVTNFRRVVI